VSGASETGPGIGTLVGNLAADLQDLVRGELRLARAEFGRNVATVMTGAISLGAGAVLALAGLTVLLQGGALLASHYVPLWGAFAAVGGGALIIGALIAFLGSNALSLKTMSPDRTSASLRKDIGVIKEHS
jgi:hypothetical protein